MTNNKIIVVGDGAVGSSYAFACTLLNVGREIGIIDINSKKAEGDALDLEDVLSFTAPKKIYSASYSDCKDADIVVITAGAPQKPGETRLDLVDKNLKIMKQIVDEIIKSGFNGIFLVAANPVDILTYAVYKYSGFPSNKVFGSGTTLDTSRFRQEIAELADVDPRSVQAYILGEHGDSEFAVWSQTNIGGLPIYEWVKQNNSDEEALLKTFNKVRDKAYEIIERKGATFYGIAAGLAKITESILNNEHSIITVSAYLDGEYGYDDIYIGVPAVVGKDGVKKVLQIPLTDTEKERFDASVDTIKSILDKRF